MARWRWRWWWCRGAVRCGCQWWEDTGSDLGAIATGVASRVGLLGAARGCRRNGAGPGGAPLWLASMRGGPAGAIEPPGRTICSQAQRRRQAPVEAVGPRPSKPSEGGRLGPLSGAGVTPSTSGAGQSPQSPDHGVGRERLQRAFACCTRRVQVLPANAPRRATLAACWLNGHDALRIRRLTSEAPEYCTRGLCTQLVSKPSSSTNAFIHYFSKFNTRVLIKRALAESMFTPLQRGTVRRCCPSTPHLPAPSLCSACLLESLTPVWLTWPPYRTLLTAHGCTAPAVAARAVCHCFLQRPSINQSPPAAPKPAAGAPARPPG